LVLASKGRGGIGDALGQGVICRGTCRMSVGVGEAVIIFLGENKDRMS